MSTLVIRDDQQTWNDQQKAALVQLGLGEASRADVEVFFHQAQRTGLDPFSRQIYMIGRWDSRARVNKYTIQTSIDGFRIIRDRKGTWRGQAEEWCGEDGVWSDVWLHSYPPKAARVLLDIEGFSKPVPGIALWSEYAPYKDGEPTGMWRKMPALMLAKCAEALALRKAYPNDLSSLYTTDEMAQADSPRSKQQPAAAPQERAVAAPVAPREPSRDWPAEANEINDLEALTALANEALRLGELDLEVGLNGDKDDGSAETVMDVLRARREELLAAAKPEPIVDVEPEREKPRDWAQDARDLGGDVEAVRALYREAEAAGVAPEVLQQIEAIEASLAAPSDEELAKDPGWAESAPADGEWNVAAIPSETPAEAAVEGDEGPI